MLGLDVHTASLRTAKAMSRFRVCTCSSAPSLHANAISNTITRKSLRPLNYRLVTSLITKLLSLKQLKNCNDIFFLSFRMAMFMASL